MMFGHLMPFLDPIFKGLALVIAAAIARRLHTPADHDRAAHLAQVAADAAALVVSRNAGAGWAETLQMVVREIAGAAGLGITNTKALERAAAGALVALGKRPNA